MPDDYSYLEGRKVKYVREDGSMSHGVVVGIDPDIGITIMKEGSKDHYLCCVRSPLVMKAEDSRNIYQQFFDLLVKEINEGVVRVKEHDELLAVVGVRGGDAPSAETCAFSQ